MLALVGLVLLAPLLLVLAALIKLDSPGPALFPQERVGLHLRTFRMWKFRSMATDAHAQLGTLRARNQMEGPLFKLADDPRVTRMGRWLRRTSLDELPQLVNVLLGDMSLVGPRPPLPDEVRGFQPWHYAKFTVRPGITGLWQVSGRSTLRSFDQIITLDLRYIGEWSLGLDLLVLARTLPVCLHGTGAW